MQMILLKVTRHRRKLYVKRLHIKKCPARRRLQEKLRHKRSLNKQLPFLHRKNIYEVRAADENDRSRKGFYIKQLHSKKQFSAQRDFPQELRI